MKNWLESWGVPRMSGSTIIGIAGLVLISIDYFAGRMDHATAASGLVAALTAILLPQHKATPEDGDKPQ